MPDTPERLRARWNLAQVASNARARRWLACAAVAALWLLLAFAQYAQWQAVRVPLGEAYLVNCSAASAGYQCSSIEGDLTAISLPIRLKARNDYTISVRGRSLTRDPVHVYVDFYGKDYDAREQKGELHLFADAARTIVMRWPSDLPPEATWLRLSSADSARYEITAVGVTRASKVVARVDALLGVLALVLLLRALRHEDLHLAARRLGHAWRDLRARHPLPALALIFAGVCSVLLLRAATLAGPVVFGDEMSYGLLAQSLGNPEYYSRNGILQPLPNQLYFDVYHLASLGGEAMLACGRALNCVLFALAVLPLYALGRRLLPQRQALLLTAAILLLPNNVYTGFFMPESFYFLGFYVVAWAFVRFIASDGRNLHAALAGVSLAALSLIKPHGLTILLACNLTLLIGICAWRGERRRIALGWLLLLVSFVLGRALLGISDAPLAQGSWLQRTFGLYASFITNTANVALDAAALQRLLLAAQNNVGSVLLLFAAPLCISVVWLTRRRSAAPPAASIDLDRLHLFAYVALACLVIGTIKFTAYIAGADPSQDPQRMHERYYDFSFGLVLLCACASLHRLLRDAPERRARAWLAIVPIIGVAGWYLLAGLPTLEASWVDHATLLGVWIWQGFDIYFAGVLALGAGVIAAFAPRSGWRVYATFLVLVAVGGFAGIMQQSIVSRELNAQDRSMLALKSLYDVRQLEHGLVVSSVDNMSPLFHTAFALRNNVAMRLLPQGAAIDVAALAPDALWVLVYGNYAIDETKWAPLHGLPANATLYRRVGTTQ